MQQHVRVFIAIAKFKIQNFIAIVLLKDAVVVLGSRAMFSISVRVKFSAGPPIYHSFIIQLQIERY